MKNVVVSMGICLAVQGAFAGLDRIIGKTANYATRFLANNFNNTKLMLTIGGIAISKSSWRHLRQRIFA